MVALILAAIIAVVAATGGVVVASDSAAPGDALYGVDRTVERVRVKMAGDEARTALLMELAEERLQETGDAGDEDLDEALDEYMTALDELLDAVIESGEADPEQLAALLEALDAYEAQLQTILDEVEEGDEAEDEDDPSEDEPDDEEDDQDDPQEDGDDLDDEDDDAEVEACVGAAPHPVVMALARSYGYEYGEVMSWFCSGYGLGEIKHALAAEGGRAAGAGDDDANGDQDGDEGAGYTAEEILALKTELGGWGEVWQHLGQIGRGRNPHNVGSPNDGDVRAEDDVDDDEDDEAAPEPPVIEPTAEPQVERPVSGNNGNNGNNGRGNGNVPPGHADGKPGNGNGGVPPGNSGDHVPPGLAGRDEAPGNSGNGRGNNGSNGRGR